MCLDSVMVSLSKLYVYWNEYAARFVTHILVRRTREISSAIGLLYDYQSECARAQIHI